MIISPLSPVPGVHVTKIISDTGTGTGTLGGAVGKLAEDDPVHVPEDPDISELVHHDVNKYELTKYPDPDSPRQSVGISGDLVTIQRHV